MPGFPVAHRRAPAALVAPLLAALVAGALPLPAAGGAATSPEPNVGASRSSPRTVAPGRPRVARRRRDHRRPARAALDRLPRGDGARGRRDSTFSPAAASRSGSARGRRIAGRSTARRRAPCPRAARQAARWRPRSRGAAGPTSPRPTPPRPRTPPRPLILPRPDPAATPRPGRNRRPWHDPGPAASGDPAAPDATPAPVDEPVRRPGRAGGDVSSPSRSSRASHLAAASGPASPGLRLPARTGSWRRRRASSTTTSSRPSPTSPSARAQGRPQEAGPRRLEHDRLGRLDELGDDDA